MFFFSSRRRHTRLQGDWSSDVCSSDLFVVRRLANLASPLRLEKEDLDIWSRAAAFIQGLDTEKRKQEQQALAALHSRVLVQIRTKSQLIGILSVSPRRSNIDFSDNDLKMLMSIAE